MEADEIEGILSQKMDWRATGLHQGVPFLSGREEGTFLGAIPQKISPHSKGALLVCTEQINFFLDVF
jgi:hypothetical protein